MLTSLIWLVGYVVSVTVAKVLYKRQHLDSSQLDYVLTAGLFLWPLFLIFTAIEHSTDYIAKLLAGPSKVRVDANSEVQNLRAENLFLASELSEAQQKLSVMDGYRNRR